MKGVAFDLGDTLIEYEGLPLSWEAHYPAALRHLARHLNFSLDESQMETGCTVLGNYNTRLHPRSREVTFSAILAELCAGWRTPVPQQAEIYSAQIFFENFRQRLRCFPETEEVLRLLRRKGCGIGIFTDVPYGMPRELVLEDMKRAGIDGLYDVLLTSGDVGYRKPSLQTLTALAAAMNCAPTALIHVGNEPKDIEVALAFGCHAVLINRQPRKSDWGQQRTISSLRELIEEQ